jgi:hypothetical protein
MPKGSKTFVVPLFSYVARWIYLYDAVVAIDGSKFKAVNNKRKNYLPKK